MKNISEIKLSAVIEPKEAENIRNAFRQHKQQPDVSNENFYFHYTDDMQIILCASENLLMADITPRSGTSESPNPVTAYSSVLNGNARCISRKFNEMLDALNIKLSPDRFSINRVSTLNSVKCLNRETAIIYLDLIAQSLHCMSGKHVSRHEENYNGFHQKFITCDLYEEDDPDCLQCFAQYPLDGEDTDDVTFNIFFKDISVSDNYAPSFEDSLATIMEDISGVTEELLEELLPHGMFYTKDEIFGILEWELNLKEAKKWRVMSFVHHCKYGINGSMLFRMLLEHNSKWTPLKYLAKKDVSPIYIDENDSGISLLPDIFTLLSDNSIILQGK